MKSKEEILDHLSKTVYTHNARKQIMDWLLQYVITNISEVKFAKHVYNRDGMRMTEGLSYEDFTYWVYGISDMVTDEVIEVPEEVADRLCKAFDDLQENILREWCIENGKIAPLDFHIGDAVKYVPTPDQSSTEYVEAIAHNSDGDAYLCLSNGEYVRPCYCVKYKVQGEERRKLIDRLNEVI